MVEVFKTNVADPKHAKMIRDHINKSFAQYEVSFDLEDCDRILRIKSNDGNVRSEFIVSLLNDFGFTAQILPDNYPLSIIRSLLNKSLCQ